MNWYNNFKQKSLLQRFLFILGLFFFILFVSLGLIFIFWEGIIPSLKNVETSISKEQRFYFGVLLIVYGTYRFFKLMHKNQD